jgi:hypothetical protein
MWQILEQLKQPLARPRKLVRTARRQARSIVDRGEVRWWNFEQRALRRVGDALAHAPEVPVLGRIGDAAGELVSRRLETITANPIPEYVTLNAKEAGRAVRELRRRVDLMAVARSEEAGKNRKTVLDAIAESLGRLDRVEAAEIPA